MKLNPASSPGDGKDGGTQRTGIAGRVEAASKLHAPAPKGRGIVMMVLGVVVLGALIWDFTGRGAASKAVTRSVGRNQPVAAPKRPIPDDSAQPPAAMAPDGSLQLELKVGEAALALSAEDAVARYRSLQGSDREAFGVQVLEALARPAGRKGEGSRQAFEVAARFVEGAAAEAERPLGRLRLLAWAALAGDDVAAPAAILFLKQLPGAGGPGTMQSLDEVILDPARPLQVRVEAARARTKEGRPAELDALAGNPDTHPSLRDALR